MYISINHPNALLEQLQTYCCNKLPSFSYDIFSDIAFICLMQLAQLRFNSKFLQLEHFFFVFCNQIFDLFNKLRARWPADLYFVIFDSSRCCSVNINWSLVAMKLHYFLFWYWTIGDQALIHESFILHVAFCHKVFYYNYIYLHSV